MPTVFNPSTLKSVMAAVRADSACQPTLSTDGKTEITHCDTNAFLTAERLGHGDIWGPLKDATATANDLKRHMDSHPTVFFSLGPDHIKAWSLANDGRLVFAAISGSPHGHIAPVLPSFGMETSGKWRCQVPYVSNVGPHKLMGAIGCNYAFGEEPCYYLVL